MRMKLSKKHSSPGQAIVEFALIITVLLLIIFLIVEASRILWAWITVQNAAREGARYAVTGQFDPPPCEFDGDVKYGHTCNDLRVASIVSRAKQGLAGLPLNETSTVFEDDNYYLIEVWGVNQSGQPQPNFAGLPNSPVVVRVYYRVPIVTPILSSIVSSVPVFGQVTMTNESFGSLGNSNQGQGVPPALPPLPTPGVTPSPTFTPTPTSSPTIGVPPTETNTPTATLTPTPNPCRIRFEGSVVDNSTFAFVTGEPGSTFSIVNANNGETLVSGVLLQPFNGHACPGFASANLPTTPDLFDANDVLIVSSSDGTVNSTIVLPAPPTDTPTPTVTATVPPTATNTPTSTPTPTPSGPYIRLLPNCGVGPTVQFTVIGVNWDSNYTVSLYWLNSGNLQAQIPAGHGGSFSQTWTKSVSGDGTYDVIAAAPNGDTFTTRFTVPCDNATAVPTGTATNTPSPADLIVVGPPQLLSTRPIVAYQPVTFQVAISNTGDIDITNQFFVDLYFDPTTVITSGTEYIPVNQSSGYVAVSALAGKESRVLTITSPIGFQNSPTDHIVYGMVDSIRQVNEMVETNNISTPFGINYVTPAATPTPTATPDVNGVDRISGLVYSRVFQWLPQNRAVVSLWSGSTLIATTNSNASGFYEFIGVPPGTYTVSACVSIDSVQYSGVRTNMSPPTVYADVFMLPGPCQ